MIRILPSLIAVIPLFAFGLVAEQLWRKKIMQGELGRKLVHILFGIWIAFWPLFISFNEIVFLCILMFFGTLLFRFLPLIHVGYDVPRKTIGQYIYPLSIAILAFLARENWQFTLAVLVLAIPDGMAAIIGGHFGKKAIMYRVYNHTKTVQGTATYFLLTMAIFTIFKTIGDFDVLSWISIFVFTGIATLLENVLAYGLDNLVIPVALMAVLRFL